MAQQQRPNRLGLLVGTSILVLLIAATTLLVWDGHGSMQRRSAPTLVEVPVAPESSPAVGSRIRPLPPAQRAGVRVTSAMLAATPVVLKLDGVPPQQAFAALSQVMETDIRLRSDAAWPASTKNLSIQGEGRPFWDVMSDLCRQAEVYPAPNAGGGRFDLVPASRGVFVQPVCQSGSFMVTATQTVCTIRADLAEDGSGSETVDVRMMLHAEPKIGLVCVGSPEIQEALDDRGNLLSAEDSPTRGPPGGWSAPVTLRLTCSAILGDQLLRVRGHIPVGVVERIELGEFADLLGAQRAPVLAGGMRWTLVETRSSTSACTIVLAVDGVTMPDIYRIAPHLVRTARLLDASGQAWQMISCTPAARPGMGDAATLRLIFTKPRGASEPRKLIVQVPVHIVELQVPFQFKNLPLP